MRNMLRYMRRANTLTKIINVGYETCIQRITHFIHYKIKMYEIIIPMFHIFAAKFHA